MTTGTVTRQEMAEALRKESDRTEKAMADLARGLLKLLGLEPTAEMGQTPWLSSSTAKGSLADLDKLSATVYQLGEVPSGPECGFCDITAEDCAERIEGGDLHAGSTEDF